MASGIVAMRQGRIIAARPPFFGRLGRWGDARPRLASHRARHRRHRGRARKPQEGHRRARADRSRGRDRGRSDARRAARPRKGGQQGARAAPLPASRRWSARSRSARPPTSFTSAGATRGRCRRSWQASRPCARPATAACTGRSRGRSATPTNGTPRPWTTGPARASVGARSPAPPSRTRGRSASVRPRPAVAPWSPCASASIRRAARWATRPSKLLGTTPLDLAADGVLRRFKSLVETGEIPTTERQPAARADTR